MAATNSPAVHEIVSELRGLVHGRVITPDDGGYDAARTLFFGGMDRHPAVIVKVADAQDVARVLSVARETGLELAVRSAGHSTAGHSAVEGGIVLDLGDMQDLVIDHKARVASVQPGLTAGAYTAAAHAHGLVTGFGDTGSVGIGGLTLGGGVGYLVRKFGLTIDDLLSAEIVTADGKILSLDEKTNPDLFWAIRGGGGNFGVATRFKFRMHELKNVHAGMLILPATPKTIADFVAAAQAAPDELSGIADIMPAPAMPLLAAEHHGKMVIFAMLVYAGQGPNAEAAVKPFRNLAKPLADMLKTMPYPEIYQPAQEGFHPIAAGRNMFVDRIDATVAEAILERLRTSTGTLAVLQVRVLGGAMARIPVDATAFAHRKAPIMMHVAAVYEKLEDMDQHEAWAEASMKALRQSSSAAYVNFVGAEGPQRVRDAYPSPTWERLVQIKRKYDPTNLFRSNQNIPPA